MPKAPDFVTNGEFTMDPNTLKVFCIVCDEERGRKWMNKRSMLKHLKTKEHGKLKLISEQRQMRREENDKNGEDEAAHRGVLLPLMDDQNYMDFENELTEPILCERDIYFDGNGAEITFAIEDGSHAESNIIKLKNQLTAYENYDWEDCADLFNDDGLDDDITVTNVMADMTNAGTNYELEDELEMDDMLTNDISSSLSNNWYPYANKTIFLIDMLDNLPRLRLSDAQLHAILFVMKQSGSHNVPSLSTIRRMQERLRKKIAVPVVERTSGRGNLFHVNDIPRQISEDFGNPLLRPHLHFYPEDKNSNIYETWNAKKWCEELSFEQLTPMAIGPNHEHFYVNELTRCHDKSYIIPKRWIYRNNILCADSYRASQTPDRIFIVDDTEFVSVALSDMYESFPALKEQDCYQKDFEIEENLCYIVNSIRVKAHGRPFYVVQLRLWGDDVSGNRSKQWNKHWVWCMAHSGLPRQFLYQEYFIRYITCSQNASVLEQASAICQQIKDSQNGIIAYDSSSQEEIMFSLNIFQLSGDNPMLAELASHIGLNGNMLCYRCHVGGSKEYKVSDEGYHKLFSPSQMRSVADSLSEVVDQLSEGIQGINIDDRQRESGIKDACAHYWLELAKKQFTGDTAGIMDHHEQAAPHLWLAEQEEIINPFLEVKGLDPHIDSPVEPLHTVLLGVAKYCWMLTCEKLSSGKNLEIFQARLTSITTAGMNQPALRANYLIQYRGALIGWQFKSLMQILPFTLHGIIADEIRILWRTLGEVGALLWYPVIEQSEQYLLLLTDAIDNFLDALASVDPNRVLAKPKCHILTHIVEDIRRYGPAMLLSTEMFECFNGVWRLCSILSNHHAPSRDIAINLADIDRFKHIASGGAWKEGANWVCPGVNVRSFLMDHRELQAHIGWVLKNSREKGSVKRVPKKRCLSIEWKDTLASKAIPYFFTPEEREEMSECFPCVDLIAGNGDVVKIGHFVVAQKRADQDVIVGKVLEIIQSASPPPVTFQSLVTIERFTVGGQHALLRMPTIHRYQEATRIVVESKHIRFFINVQHDCERGGCSAAATMPEMQERKQTRRHTSVVLHKDEDHYIVNVQALHNVNLVRAVFPAATYSIPKIAEDRRELHEKLANKLRQTKEVRAATTKARRAATKAVREVNER